jgi:hypothetical protein
VQRKLLQAQVDGAIRSMGDAQLSVPILQSIYDKSTVLGTSEKPLQSAFWSHYNAKKLEALTELKKFDVASLGDVADLLSTYYAFVQELDWNEEKIALRKEVCGLVREQVAVIVNKQDIDHALKAMEGENVILCDTCRKSQPAVQGCGQLSLHGWNSIFRSIRLVSARKDFADSFAQEMVLIGQLNDKFASRLVTAPVCCCSVCKPNACRYHVNTHHYCSKCRAFFYRQCEKSLMKEWDVKYSDGKFNVVTTPGSIEIPARIGDTSLGSAAPCWNLYAATRNLKARGASSCFDISTASRS